MIVKNIEEFLQFLEIGRPILSIDYGSYKTGIAISDVNHKIAFPKSFISSNSSKEKILQIQKLILRLNPCALVIGIAFNFQNEFTNSTKSILAFSKQLAKITELPIFFQDERSTSRLVHKLDFFYKLSNKNSPPGREDMLAARAILESVLESIKQLKNDS
ncbi:MAG: pre-16S rRNA-processing nuclease YqgF [Rickettsia sp.]|nr:pre-16S rRNA-processing nuclease YqgF [Rickettsia sp.]